MTETTARDDTPAAPLAHYRRMRLLSLLSLLGVGVVHGLRAAAIPEGQDVGPGALLVAVLLGTLTATWCLFDGRVRGRAPASVGLMAIFVLPPIGLLGYCVWSRGWVGILLALGIEVLFVMAVAVAAFVGIEVLGDAAAL